MMRDTDKRTEEQTGEAAAQVAGETRIETRIDGVEPAVPREEDIAKAIDEATQLKQTGNADFKAAKFQSALSSYCDALAILPLAPHLSPAADLPLPPDPQSDLPDSSRPLLPNSRVPQLRSILNANIAACFLKLEDWQSAVQSCGNSLKDDPKYVKALHRRAQANEKLGTWASLQASLDDYNKLSEMSEVQDKALKQEIQRAQTRLPELVRLKSEQDKAEMMDKLKDLGNSVLGKFGMSTDNFKFTPNGSGGYSMSFQQ